MVGKKEDCNLESLQSSKPPSPPITTSHFQACRIVWILVYQSCADPGVNRERRPSRRFLSYVAKRLQIPLSNALPYPSRPPGCKSSFAHHAQSASDVYIRLQGAFAPKLRDSTSLRDLFFAEPSLLRQYGSCLRRQLRPRARKKMHAQLFHSPMHQRHQRLRTRKMAIPQTLPYRTAR